MKNRILPGILLGTLFMSLLAGCGYFSQYSNFEHARQLRVGMSETEVRELMGEPLDVPYAKPDIWYYYIETRWHDGQSTIDECMPLVFKKGQLAGWGNAYYNHERLLKQDYQRPVIEGLK